MKNTPDWLPPLVLLGSHSGNWNHYVEALYRYYKQDFVDSQPVFRGLAVQRKVTPVEQGKEASFWHLISEGKKEADRIPDMRRCERIRWPRPVVEHVDEPSIKVWENKRGRDTRICIWFEAIEYLVVLAVRRGYYLLWTAYPVTRPHTKRNLRREYEAYTKANAAPL
jgi:hypothetical protein